LKARVICKPAACGGGYDPEELRQELEDYELMRITTESVGDATEAAREWRDGLLIVAGGDGTIAEVVALFGVGRSSSNHPVTPGPSNLPSLALFARFVGVSFWQIALRCPSVIPRCSRCSRCRASYWLCSGPLSGR